MVVRLCLTREISGKHEFFKICIFWGGKRGKPLFFDRYVWTTRREKEQPWILTTPYIVCCILSRFSRFQLSGSSVHGILQARILECVAISSSRESSWPKDRSSVSYISCIGRQILYYLSYLGSPYIGLAKKFIVVFLWAVMENPEWTFWPTQYRNTIWTGRNTNRISSIQKVLKSMLS